MELRLLGKTGLKVSVLSFGAMTFGGDGMFSRVGDVQLADAKRQVGLCLDAGVNLFDTADIYSNGHSEAILGEALGVERKRIVLATKAFAPMGEGPNDLGLSRKHLIEACEASLKRLKTDHIDLYQVHSFDALTPVEETLKALDDLVRAGKVRYIGCSNFSGWHLMKALAASDRLGLERYATQQIQYSLMCRDSEFELLPLGVDQGVGALLWSPLAQGFLSGKFKPGAANEGSRIASTGQLAGFDNPRAHAVIAALTEIAAHYPGASIAQTALNWLRRKAGVTSIIIGARTEAQLKDNLAAARWNLTDADIARLDEASAIPVPYPYYHQRNYTRGRVPLLGLLPLPVKE